MTTQVVPPVGGLLVLLTPLVLLGLMISAAVQVSRGHTRLAARLAGLIGAVALLYAMALLGTGLVSTPQQLQVGDTKCFDDWCAAMRGSHRDMTNDRLLVDVRLENRGRGRAMKSDLARAYIEVPGRGNMPPRDGQRLQLVIEAATQVDIQLVFDVPAGMSGARFVVAEGTDNFGPGTLTIGDEVSPFHARAGWPLVRG